EAAVRDVPDVLASLNSSPDGISRIQSLARRQREGPNEIAAEKPPRWYVQLLLAFKTPFNFLLLSLAVVSLLTEDYRAATVIAVMVAISSLLRFVQEYRSGRAAETLRALVQTTATGSRPGRRADVAPEAAVSPDPGPRQEEVPIRDLAPGDVVQLSVGDVIPADVRLLAARDLFVSQSALTGESMPVEKT